MSEEKTKKETVLNTLFECREESLYTLTENYIDRINIIGAYENGNFYKIRIF